MKKYNYITLIAILIFYTNSFAQFGEQQEITARLTNPNNLLVIDINGDGHLDLLSSSSNDHKIVWYQNDGTGHFGSEQFIDNIEHTKFVTSADIDGDGDVDLVSASGYDDQIVWFQNDGSGNFGLKHIISTNVNNPFLISAADIDGDGDVDFVSASHNDEGITIFFNNGTGEFVDEQILFNDWGGLYSIYLADINNDGAVDILYNVSLSSGRIAWHENDGSGNFGPQQLIDSPGHSTSIYLVDLDGDSDLDVLSITHSNSEISWYQNDGTGNFSDQQIVGNSARDFVYSSDIDGDGDMDVLSASENDEEIICFYNDGLCNFETQQILIEDADNTLSIYETDIDGDGDIDLFSTSNGDNKILHYKNDGMGGFELQQVMTYYAYGANSICTSDLNGDGIMDVLSSSSMNHKIAWYKNNGFGNFDIQQIIDTNNVTYARFVNASDLDGDGDNDVLSVFNDEIRWYRNDGTGSFDPYQIISSDMSNPFIVYAFDIDGDGDNDVLIGSQDYEIRWYRNDGTGNFVVQQVISTGGYLQYTCPIDMDSDGDIDVLTVCSQLGRMSWYRNDGLGSFGSEQVITYNSYTEIVYPVDFDNDGDIDILAGSSDQEKMSWYENNGMEFFTIQYIANSEQRSHFTTCDLDGDGDNDIISGELQNDKIAWQQNDGQFNFSDEEIITTDIFYIQSILTCDIDGDGDLDVISASSNDRKIAWYENYNESPNKIIGNTFFDQNQNSIKDTNENGFNFCQLELNPNALASFSNEEGEFRFSVDTGSYILSYQTLENWSLTTDSSEFHVSLTSSEPVADSLDFGFYPDTFLTSINPELIVSNFRCSEEGNLWLTFQNTGTTNPDCIVELILDPQIAYLSSLLNPDSIIGQNIYWHSDTLDFFASEQIHLVIEMPDFNSMGDTLTNVINIYTIDSIGQSFYTDTLRTDLECSFDPNDKLVSPMDDGINDLISNTDTLEYTLRFQNTGNAEAINIQIRDQIDENLDIQSIQILASSHDLESYVEQNCWLVFKFDSILLPDSTANFIESQGFVKYSVKVKDDVIPHTQIFNTANIYFDNNPPVITNTVSNTVGCYIVPIAPEISHYNNTLQVQTNYELQWFFNGAEITNATDTFLLFSEYGDYSIIVTDENGCFAESEVYTVTNVNIENLRKGTLMIYPNPTSGYFHIEGDNIERIEVYNVSGKLIINTIKKEIDLSHTTKGIYFVKILSKNFVSTKKVIVK